MVVVDSDVNKALIVGLTLVLATGIQLYVTTRVSGYILQVLSALVTIGLALAAVAVLIRSLAEPTDRS